MAGASWDPEQEAERSRGARRPWNARRKTFPPPGGDPGKPGVMPGGMSAEADTISVPGAAAGADRSADPAFAAGADSVPGIGVPYSFGGPFSGRFPAETGLNVTSKSVSHRPLLSSANE